MGQPKPWIKFTVKDYISTPDDKRYQLLDGEMILAPSPTERHQTIAMNLVLSLQRFVREHSLGRVWFAPLDVVLSNHDVAQPDILFVSNARAERVTRANVQGWLLRYCLQGRRNTTGATSRRFTTATVSGNTG